MGTTATIHTIRKIFYCLGLHATPKVVVHALSEQGIPVDEELVRQVRMELLKETTGARVIRVLRPVASPAVRRPQGFPGRRDK
jgi:hypothetical protein